MFHLGCRPSVGHGEPDTVDRPGGLSGGHGGTLGICRGWRCAAAGPGRKPARGKNDITASLTADEKAAFDEAVRSGVIDVTMATTWPASPRARTGTSPTTVPVMSQLPVPARREVQPPGHLRGRLPAGARGGSRCQGRLCTQAAQATYDRHFDYSANNRARDAGQRGRGAAVQRADEQLVYTCRRSAQQSLKGATPEAPGPGAQGAGWPADHARHGGRRAGPAHGDNAAGSRLDDRRG